MTEYHDGLPMLPPAKAAEVADKLRIQVIGLRAGWSAWAAREAGIAGETWEPSRQAADDRWRELMKAEQALKAAETQLEAAIELIGKEAQP